MIAKEIGASGATYKGIEFSGEAVKGLSISGRITLCNMAIEVGAKTGIVEADEKAVDYIQRRTDHPYTLIQSDPNGSYERILEIDTKGMPTLIACPDS
ncbi:MAG: 3-isopropylmalate dehydratase large subunit, partial [Nitrososphaeria archaeon]|nr:3-isopropylmalate dehydratase large subunit [Nitrososphaeria archaeon]